MNYSKTVKKNEQNKGVTSGFIAQKLQRFFAKRAPKADESSLNLRNVYIFFSRSGLLYCLLIVITFIMGINYGNNLVLGLCFYLASIWVISLHLTFSHIFGLKIRLLETQLVQADEVSWVTLELINDKSQPSRQLHLTFDHNLQLSSNLSANTHKESPLANNLFLSGDKIKDNTEAFDNDAPKKHRAGAARIWQLKGIQPNQKLTHLKGRQRVNLPVLTTHRGRLPLPRLIISTVYPLGIMRAWSYVYFASPIWVYPKPKAFDWQTMQAVNSSEEQDFSAHMTIGQNDFESLDEYIEGESLARVSWAHLARGQGMLTKHFADPVGREQLLDYIDMPAAHHEEKLAQLTYAVLKVGKEGGAFQLNLPHDIGSVGQGEAFVNACLLRLAKCP